MNKNRKSKAPSGGLGRSLAELLSDNDQQANLENKVLVHKNDGSTVKVYDKPDPHKKAQFSSRKSKISAKSTNNLPLIGNDGDNLSLSEDKRTSKTITSANKITLNTESAGVHVSKKTSNSQGTVDASWPVKIAPASAKREEPQTRIVIDSCKSSSGMTIAEGLDQLDRYRPVVKDAFLEELLEISEATPSSSYETDSEGRIIIGAPNRSKVKRR